MSKIPDPNVIYGIPLDDGSFTLIQTIEDLKILNGYAIAIFKGKYSASEIDEVKISRMDVFAILATSRDLMTKSKWIKFPVQHIDLTGLKHHYNSFRTKGWIGLKIYGSETIVEMMNAYHGMRDWKMMKDPEYFDKIVAQNSV